MLETFRFLICNHVPVEPESITPQSKLYTDLGLTSLDMAMLSTEIESEFSVSVPDDLFVRITTLGELMDYIASRQSV